MTEKHPTVRLYGEATYAEKIAAIRHAFATPGVHTLKDTSAALDRLEAEARAVVSIHHRDAVVTRLSPLVLRIENHEGGST
jgi:hypothetical protein